MSQVYLRLYIFPIFLLSGRIEPMVRIGAGLENSWSWNESNFHPDDPLDITYTDPDFVPSYTLSGFSQATIYEGR